MDLVPKKHILLIEDDFFIQDIYQRVFVDAGYDVTLASDGEEALDRVQGGTYDLILLDIMLPKITGIELLKRFREPHSPVKKIPILLITNLGQEEIIKQVFSLGADGYLIKAQVKPTDVLREVNTFFAENKRKKSS